MAVGATVIVCGGMQSPCYRCGRMWVSALATFTCTLLANGVGVSEYIVAQLKAGRELSSLELERLTAELESDRLRCTLLVAACRRRV